MSLLICQTGHADSGKTNCLAVHYKSVAVVDPRKNWIYTKKTSVIERAWKTGKGNWKHEKMMSWHNKLALMTFPFILGGTINCPAVVRMGKLFFLSKLNLHAFNQNITHCKTLIIGEFVTPLFMKFSLASLSSIHSLKKSLLPLYMASLSKFIANGNISKQWVAPFSACWPFFNSCLMLLSPYFKMTQIGLRRDKNAW